MVSNGKAKIIDLKSRERTSLPDRPILPWEMPITPEMYEFLLEERNADIVKLVSFLYKHTFMIGYQVVELSGSFLIDMLRMDVHRYLEAAKLCVDRNYMHMPETNEKKGYKVFENIRQKPVYETMCIKYKLNKKRFLGENSDRILIDYRKLTLGYNPNDHVELYQLYPEIKKPGDNTVSHRPAKELDPPSSRVPHYMNFSEPIEEPSKTETFLF